MSKPRIEDLVVRPMQSSEVAAADSIFRKAFGTYLGLPDPLSFGGDGDYLATRYRAFPEGAFVALSQGQVVGSNLVTIWGSVGFFGPLTVEPALWDRGVARALLVPTVDLFKKKRVRVSGLYTFAQSNKHVRLYQSFGFWPRFLNVTLATEVRKSDARPFATLSQRRADRETSFAAIRELSDSVFPGFDPTIEARAVLEQSLGDTVLVRDDRGSLEAFAVVHVGKGTEAGSDSAYMKVAAVRPSPRARETFPLLLDACESFASSRGVSHLRGGVHASRLECYRVFVDRGWRSELQGVCMFSPADGGGYDRPDLFVIEDWR